MDVLQLNDAQVLQWTELVVVHSREFAPKPKQARSKTVFIIIGNFQVLLDLE